MEFEFFNQNIDSTIKLIYLTMGVTSISSEIRSLHEHRTFTGIQPIPCELGKQFQMLIIWTSVTIF